MKKILIIIGAVALLVFIVTHPISGLNSESVVRLKAAGVSDRTIQVMVREKVVETSAFSVQEIIDMKKAGLSEKTIQMVIREGSFLKDTLKKAGISDEVIQAIIYVVGESSDSQRQDAWELLREMEIRVDLRDGD
jgi:hypothetical protein